MDYTNQKEVDKVNAEINAEVKEHGGMYGKISSATFMKRWVESMLLPGAASALIAVSSWVYNSNAEDRVAEAKENYNEAMSKIDPEVRKDYYEARKYLQEHEGAYSYVEYKDALEAVDRYNRLSKEKENADYELSEARHKEDVSRKLAIAFSIMTGISMLLALATNSGDGVEHRMFKQYDPERIYKLFLNYENGKPYDKDIENYYNTLGYRYEGVYETFAERINDLGKIGNKILKEFGARYYSGEGPYISNLKDFNIEQQVAILQGYFSLYPEKAKEIFEKIKTLELPELAFSGKWQTSNHRDGINRDKVENLFKEKRAKETEEMKKIADSIRKLRNM